MTKQTASTGTPLPGSAPRGASHEPRISFPAGDLPSFLSEVRRRVATHFETSGQSPKANLSMVVKTVILFAATIGSYVLILSGQLPGPAAWGLCVVLGIGIAGIGFCVAHDSLHEAYSSSRTLNRILGWSFDMIGANGYIWRITHNVIHHTYTNIDGVDDDLEASPLLRLSPGTPWRPVHRFQHIHAFFAYGLSTLNWVFLKDYRYFLRRDIGPFRDRSNPPSEVAGLIAWKALYYAYTIVIPIWVLRPAWWQFLLGYLTVQLTSGFILGIVFQLAHIVEATDYPVADAEGDMGHTWAIHQMETTSDFATGNRWLSWYVGGLNFQVEHHLFPKVCSVHYPAVRRIVREVAQEYGIPYNEHPTLWAAVRSHYRMLKQFGRMPAPAGALPLP